MGKLNIAHHKSYHPYRRDNIERVKRDEEEAKLKEQKEEGRMMLADAEARMDLLRQRAHVSESSEKKGKRRKDEDDMKLIASSSSMQAAVLPTTDGHINLFEDLEHTQKSITAAIRAKKSTSTETEKGIALAPALKDLNPWYSDRNKDNAPVDQDEGGSERRRREEYRKAAHDPLTSITKQLSANVSSSSSAPTRSTRPPKVNIVDKPGEVQARLSRESSERQRALELIRRKQREMEGNATPSTVFAAGGYGDMYNRREVEEAHRHRDRRREGGYGNRRWGDDDHSHSRRPKQW